MKLSWLYDLAEFAGRMFLAALFLWDAWIMMSSYDATAAYMQSHGVPAVMLPVAMFTQLAGGLLLVLGLQTRLAAFVLAGFCFSTAIIFHSPTGSSGEQIQFWKDIALTGGFLVLFANGARRWSLDSWVAGGHRK